MGIPVAVRRAVSAYRQQQLPPGQEDTWFNLEIPMTSDKIRMACQDAITKTVENGATKVEEKDKIGVQL